MDILLAHGYYLEDDPHEAAVMKPYPPLGILYLSSYLKTRGFEVGVFDATFSNHEDFKELVVGGQPAVVGIYANMLTRRAVLKMIEECRENGSTVVLGGPDPANYPKEYLARGADVVVVGEGERTLEELLHHLRCHGLSGMEGIQGLVYRGDDGCVVRAEPRPYLPDLDAQPFPDRDAVEVERYLWAWRQCHGYGSLSLITARGCAYRCAWCSHAVYGYTHRRRSPQNVANELEELLATYHPEAIWYADDVFTINRHWLSEYAGELKRRGLRPPFETISREDRLDEEVVRTLAEMGCRRLWIGAESGSQRVLDAMDRRANAGRVRTMVSLLQEYDIEAGMFIMLGYDSEEVGDLETTVDHLKTSNPDVFLTTLAYPIKGTPYYERVADRVISMKPWEEGSDRDNTVAGRHSRRFYSFANRWMVSEVGLTRQLGNPGRDYLRIAKSFVSARLGHLGMSLTRHEVERG
jgi:anaerobic magnesium-protoporphyrin IX monomethyl ester cyclase